MRRSHLAAVTAVAVTTSLLAASGPAAAGDEKQACLAASDKAQQLKLDGRLLKAREQLNICGRQECPAIVRQDCAQWMTELLASLPSVVIGARDWQGHDVLAVHVTIDGVLATDKLDGKPIPVDPGVHKFRYEAQGEAPVDEQVLVREGEKNRNLTVNFPAPPGAQAAAGGTAAGSGAGAGVAPRTDNGGGGSSGGISPFAWVFAGLGVVALGSAGYFALSANNDVNDLQTQCAPNCPASRVDPIRTKQTLAWVSLGVGVVSLGVATYFFIARPSRSSVDVNASGNTAWRFDFVPAKGGGVAALGARF